MNYILSELAKCETRVIKKNNADQVGFIRSPDRAGVLKGFADLIKDRQCVEMSQDFFDRTSRCITQSVSWDASQEIMATVIVTAPTDTAQWSQALEHAGVDRVVVLTRPRDVRLLKEELNTSKVVIVASNRSKDVLKVLNQSTTVIPDHTERQAQQLLNDILATSSDLRDQQVCDLNNLKKRLSFVLKQIAKGQHPQLIQRRKIIQGIIPQRVIFDTPTSIPDLKRIHGKYTWFTHETGVRTTRDRFSIDIDHQLTGIDKDTISVDLYSFYWELVKRQCLLQQSLKTIKRPEQDIFDSRSNAQIQYRIFDQLESAIGNETQILEFLSQVAIISQAEDLPQYYQSHLCRDDLSFKSAFAPVSHNCVEILKSEDRQQCMLCFTSPQNYKIVFCCCCFMCCPSCLARMILNQRYNIRDLKCPQCRRVIYNRDTRTGTIGADRLTLSLIIIPNANSQIRHRALEDEVTVVKRIKDQIDASSGQYIHLRQIINASEGEFVIKQTTSDISIIVTLGDIQAATMLFKRPAEQAYQDAVVKCTNFICSQFPSKMITVRFVHVLASTYKTPLQFPCSFNRCEE